MWNGNGERESVWSRDAQAHTTHHTTTHIVFVPETSRDPNVETIELWNIVDIIDWIYFVLYP